MTDSLELPSTDALADAGATTPQEVLSAVAAAGTAPRLTWYDGAERIELSGRVLTTWAAKTANLLRDELDVAPGEIVTVALPPGHWRALYWMLGAWTAGAGVDLRSGDISPDDVGAVYVGVDADVAEAVARTGASAALVTLPALARSAERLPGGVIDEAAELPSQGDQAGAPHRWSTETPLLLDGAPARAVHRFDGAARVWLDPVRLDAAAYARTAAGVWAGGGSIVSLSVASPNGSADDGSRVASILRSEGVTHDGSGGRRE